jgi:hypothetical protein
MWVSVRIGASRLRRRQNLEATARKEFAVIQGATLTLLGLIIAFSFSMPVSRYDLRESYEEAGANAIHTEYVRADLLPAADALKVRALLKRYLDQRVLFYETRDAQQLQRIDDNDTARPQALANELTDLVCIRRLRGKLIRRRQRADNGRPYEDLSRRDFRSLAPLTY